MKKNLSTKILIIEDEPALSAALKEKLEAHYYEITTATNGKEALEILSNSSFDLIILDIILPIMDGLKFLESLKKFNKTPPIFVLTNLDEAEVRDEADRRQVSGYIQHILTKAHIPLNVLVENIEDFLAKQYPHSK